METIMRELIDIKLNLANLREELKKEVGVKEKVRACYVTQAYLNAAIERIDETIEKPFVYEEE